FLRSQGRLVRLATGVGVLDPDLTAQHAALGVELLDQQVDGLLEALAFGRVVAGQGPDDADDDLIAGSPGSAAGLATVGPAGAAGLAAATPAAGGQEQKGGRKDQGEPAHAPEPAGVGAKAHFGHAHESHPLSNWM